MTIVLTGAAHAAGDGRTYDLLIERSPVAAGTVTPNTGMHRLSPNSTISLKAEAEPGYRFAYWLGDVSDPAAERTTILLDTDKVVVAVFHPEPRQCVEEQLACQGGGGGDSLLLASATDLAVPSWGPSGRGKGGSIIIPTVRPEIVTPEPGTIALLGLGVLALRRRPLRPWRALRPVRRVR